MHLYCVNSFLQQFQHLFKGVAHQPAWSSKVWLFQGSPYRDYRVHRFWTVFFLYVLIVFFVVLLAFVFSIFHCILLKNLNNIFSFPHNTWCLFRSASKCCTQTIVLKGVFHQPAWSTIIWLFQGSSIVFPFLVMFL